MNVTGDERCHARQTTCRAAECDQATDQTHCANIVTRAEWNAIKSQRHENDDYGTIYAKWTERKTSGALRRRNWQTTDTVALRVAN